MGTKLNVSSANAARPGETVRDHEVRGLELRCFDSGVKTFYLRYRTPAGQRRNMKLGEYGQGFTLAAARDLGARMLLRVRNGEDPGDKVAARQALLADASQTTTMDQLWAAALEQKIQPKNKQRTIDGYTALWERCISPLIGKRRVVEIDVTACQYVFNKINKDTPIQALACMRLLSKLLNYAVSMQVREPSVNPVKFVEGRPKYKRRKRPIKPHEALAIRDALLRHQTTAQKSVAFILLLFYTGARTEHIRNARWENLHELPDRGQGRTGYIELKDSKTGEAVVYLSARAMQVIDHLPRTNGTLTGILTPAKLWQLIRREAGCPDLRLHDLRHNYATVARANGVPIEAISRNLNHKSIAITSDLYTDDDPHHLVKTTTVAGDALDRMFQPPPLAPPA